jgi:hypothetical protein
MRRLRIPRCDYINDSTVWDLVTMRFSGVRGAKRKTAEQNGNMSVMTFMVGGLLAVS